MKKKELIIAIERETKKFFSDKKDGCHDWSHVERVRKIAMHIGKIEKADLFILEIAAIMHDIGRECEVKSRGKVCHAQAGAKIAEDILKMHSLDDRVIEKITHCIESHRYKANLAPKTLEAKILFDSDKLDSIGAVGIGRVFMFAGITSGLLCTGNEKKLAKSSNDLSFTKDDTAPLEYELKLKYISKRIMTKTGRQIANERQKFMAMFFDRFWKEVEGKI